MVGNRIRPLGYLDHNLNSTFQKKREASASLSGKTKIDSYAFFAAADGFSVASRLLNIQAVFS